MASSKQDIVKSRDAGVVSRVLVAPIRFYQRFVSPLSPPVCRFTPTCSNYTLEAILRHGALKGTWLGARRIVRCNPWGGMGFDPVPPRITDFHTHRNGELRGIVNAELCDFAPHGSLLYSLGVHPWHADDSEAFALLEKWAVHPQVVALGETGLDTLRGPELKVQQAMLERHIELAGRLGKPLVIHCVRAYEQLIAVKRSSRASGVQWAIHGFRGGEKVAKRLLDEGFYLSFGAKFNDEALKLTPEDRLLIETDEAQETIKAVAQKVAAGRSTSSRAIIKTTEKNALKFINPQ